MTIDNSMQVDVAKATASLAFAFMCATACAGLLYEPGNYAAQDNCVVNLDGIRNAGLLKAHDSSATEWKNIGRAANDAEFFAKSGDTSGWVADGYHFAGGAYGKLKFKQNLGAEMTVQIVADVKGSENSVSWPTFFGNPNDRANIYLTDNAKGNVSFKADDSTGLGWQSRAGVTCGANVKYLNAALNANEHKQILVSSDSFATGWKEGTTTATNVVGSQNWSFGSCGADGTFNDKALGNRYLVGTIKAIRVYNKVLSNTELAANRVIDEARFFTGIPVTNVVVATAVAGLEGNEGSGAYAYDEEGYTFTAPQKATKDGTVYSCSGYTLETWDGSAWSAPVSSQSTSCRLTNTSAKVRLTWQWQRAHAEVPVALDPLFDDYVTDGLVLHLDGIRNVGADKPHSWTSSEWIDLVKGNIASLQHDYADTSTWTDDGYYFGGRSFAQFVNGISLTNTVTVQVVCDTTTNALQKFKTSRDPNVLWPNLVSSADSDQLNIYYDMNRGSRGRLTFKNANGGNVNLANDADKDAWEGRYATAIRNGNKNYILQTTSIADAVSLTHSVGNISMSTIRVGGANSILSSRQQRWFLGTIKAVRIYNRVLSDAELAQNREIDEARFFGGPLPTENVVVASSVRGVEGNEPEGTYALPAGGHTFTAPASVTVGEDSYSCTGYTLETWDGSAWSSPVSYASSSYSATDITAKVRLTWLWSHTAGPGYDAAFSDYVTDGLVLHLDGIRNAGTQAAHDDNAVSWADLANKGGAAKFVNGDGNSGWKGDGYFFGGASYGIMNGTRTLDGPFTVQTVLDFDRIASHRIDTYYPMIVGTTEPGDKFSIYINQEGRADSQVFTKVLGSSALGGISNWVGDYMTVLANGSQVALFPEATPATWNACANLPGTRTFTVAGSNGSDSNPWGRRMLTGTIKSVRVYGRVLSDAELAQNRAADEVRFFGRAPAATGALIVASDMDGLSGDQPNGAYRPAAGYTFTSPAEAVFDGVSYELVGYTLETWDGSAWGAADVHNGEYTVAPDVTTASKRLTWNWTVKSRLTKLQDSFDVGDYVQSGLYLHFDGIRNAGKTAAHDDTATTWVNLGTGGANFNATFDFEKSDATASGWAADGYNFTDGGKFAKLANYPTLGSFVTVQIVCDVGAGTSSFPTLFGSTNDFCNLYAFTAGKRLFFKVLNQKGRPELSPQNSWEGQFANGGWVDGKCAVYQSATPDPSIWVGTWRDTKLGALNGAPFYIGGVYFPNSTKDTNDRRLAGKIQAIRVYTRSLSDEELAHNRMVDEARFKGNPPASNVTIAEGEFSTIEEETGNYRVDGVYTFTASDMVDGDGKKRKVRGALIEEWNGSEWVKVGVYGGKSYEFNAASGKKIRLTWRWGNFGTCVLVR
ncbi:MAG: hypothetical protein K6G91_09450 [Kiritimatiellae bacterium]|nr:hypothetical protein [Kiritimatiellia bacterium]